MSKKLDISRRALTLFGLGAIIAVLAPVGVIAATGITKIQDGNGTSKVQVDNGSLRVGDGSGVLTVAGTGNNGNVPVTGNVGVNGTVGVSGIAGDVSTVGKPSTILAQGDCDTVGGDTYSPNGSIPAGKTVVGIVLSDEQGNSPLNTLTVSAASVVGNQRGPHLFTLGNGENFSTGYAQFGTQLDFGSGIRLNEAWSINCTGQPNASQGNGLWIVYGY